MFKRIVLIILALFILITVGIAAFEIIQKPKFSNTLSQRSKEFIKSQSLGGVNEYSPLMEEKGEDFKGKRVSVGNCFSFVMPYSVFNSRQESECGWYFAFDRPKGSIVAFMEDSVTNSLDDAPGVSMRRLDPKKYEERVMEVGEKSFLGFVDKTDQFTITIYHNINNKYLIFTLKLPRENDEELKVILSSLEFN